MSETQIPVAEQFLSIQGEGPYAGTPSVFLRLAGCNLQCGLHEDESVADFEKGQEPTAEDASWICDTIDVWREAQQTYTPEKLYKNWEMRSWKDRLVASSDADVTTDTHVVLTGGEPMLRQEEFVDFMELFREKDVAMPFVEVETNGTMIPEPAFDEVVDHYNVSLKLSNSGHSRAHRINEEAIKEFVDRQQKAEFKFVVGNQADLDEIVQLSAKYDIPSAQIMLMPAGQTREQLNETYPMVSQACIRSGYRFSPRLHVNIWNEQCGV